MRDNGGGGGWRRHEDVGPMSDKRAGDDYGGGGSGGGGSSKTRKADRWKRLNQKKRDWRRKNMKTGIGVIGIGVEGGGRGKVMRDDD